MHASVKIALYAFLSLRILFSKHPSFHLDQSRARYKSPFHFLLAAPPPLLTLDAGKHFARPLLLASSTTYVLVDGKPDVVRLSSKLENDSAEFKDITVYDPKIQKTTFMETLVVYSTFCFAMMFGFVMFDFLSSPGPTTHGSPLVTIHEEVKSETSLAPTTPKEANTESLLAIPAYRGEPCPTPELVYSDSHPSVTHEPDFNAIPCSTPKAPSSDNPVAIFMRGDCARPNQEIVTGLGIQASSSADADGFSLSNTLICQEIKDTLGKDKSIADSTDSVPSLCSKDNTLPVSLSASDDSTFVTCGEPSVSVSDIKTDQTVSTGSANPKDTKPMDVKTQERISAGEAPLIFGKVDFSSRLLSSSIHAVKDNRPTASIPWGDSVLHMVAEDSELACPAGAPGDYEQPDLLIISGTPKPLQEPSKSVVDITSPIASSTPIHSDLTRPRNRVMLSIPVENHCVLEPLYILPPKSEKELTEVFKERASGAGIVIASTSSSFTEETMQRAKQFWEDPRGTLPAFAQSRSILSSPVLYQPMMAVVSIGSVLEKHIVSISDHRSNNDHEHEVEATRSPSSLNSSRALSVPPATPKRQRTVSMTVDFVGDNDGKDHRETLMKRLKLVDESNDWRARPAGPYGHSRCPWRVKGKAAK